MEQLLNTAEIYLVQEELSRNKENVTNKYKLGCGKDSKGKKLKAPYKDRPSKNILQRRNEKPYHYKNLKESLFHKERMVKKKPTVRIGGKQRKQKMEVNEGEEKGDCEMDRKVIKRNKEKWLRSKASSKRCQMEAMPPTSQFQRAHGDKKISKIHRIVNQKVVISKISKRIGTRDNAKFVIPNNCAKGFTRSH